MKAVRAVSGMRTSPSLNPMIGKIAPRPVLLIASSGFENEIAAYRVYQRHGGPTAELWELEQTPHTGGLRTHPAKYERRVVGFLDRALAP
jgi:hypothetical protein